MVAYDTDVGSDPGTNPGLVEAFRRTIGNSNAAHFPGQPPVIQGFIDTHTIKQFTVICQFLFCST